MTNVQTQCCQLFKCFLIKRADVYNCVRVHFLLFLKCVVVVVVATPQGALLFTLEKLKIEKSYVQLRNKKLKSKK